MVIAFLTEIYRPFASGGGGHSIEAQAVALAGRGVRVVVLTPNYGAASRETLDGVEVWRAPFLRGGFCPRWLTNPLLGSGYATLTAEKIGIFTEAESTDNDYLRALGETGILGFLAFYGTIFLALRYAWVNRRRLQDPLVYALIAGITTGTIGLLVNATYIDVFEASKVAFTFWALIGLMVATIDLSLSKHAA